MVTRVTTTLPLRNSKGLFVKGHLFTEEMLEKMSQVKNGKRISPNTEFKKGMKAIHPFQKGIIPWNKGKKGLQKHTEEFKQKAREKALGNKYSLGRIKTFEEKLHQSQLMKGENAPWWKGGITSINKTIRRSLEYRLWRSAVFKRDEFTCQKCNQRGGNLEADHIKPFALYPDLRFDIDNGRTLCQNCHRKTETYGFKRSIYGN